MRIIMITPAAPKSRSGNRATAIRWARILRDLGHQVTLSVDYEGAPYDLMVALHAWRSAHQIAKFDALFPDRPLIVALTGTDLYRFIHSHPKETLESISMADRLITLHELAHEAIPAVDRPKVHVIYQSAIPLPQARAPIKRSFDVCVVGHLREEKDPLRTAFAVRDLPAASRIRVLHYGKAHDEQWTRLAHQEMGRNPRYHWFGELPHWQIRRAYSRCRVMVLSSIMEGGANVISEALLAGLPVIASDIAGSVGLLGREYPGYYPVKDTLGLRHRLEQVENDSAFLRELNIHCQRRAALFTPARELELWKALLAGIISPT